jgi:hypothetical protein
MDGIDIKPLPLETAALTGFNYLMTIDWTAVKVMTSGTLQAVFPNNALGVATITLPAGKILQDIAGRVATAFAFTPGTLSFKLGDDGDDDRYFSAVDLKTAAYINGVIANRPYLYAAANTIDFIATAGAGALTSVTAGSLEIYLKLGDLAALSSGGNT